MTASAGSRGSAFEFKGIFLSRTNALIMSSAAIFAALTVSAASARPPLPSSHADKDIYIRFERIGYYGNVYLNKDGTYLIVQTGPNRKTQHFTGKWVAKGSSGFCITPDGPFPGKCLLRTPGSMRRAEEIISDLNETYRFSLKTGR